MFIPCLTFGAMVFILLRSMARGYEFEMNKCYGCDLCDDACPVRLFNGGDKLNIITTLGIMRMMEFLYSCLTCIPIPTLVHNSSIMTRMWTLEGLVSWTSTNTSQYYKQFLPEAEEEAA